MGEGGGGGEWVGRGGARVYEFLYYGSKFKIKNKNFFGGRGRER